MFLNPADIEVAYMRHMSLIFLKCLVARLLLECKYVRANI